MSLSRSVQYLLYIPWYYLNLCVTLSEDNWSRKESLEVSHQTFHSNQVQLWGQIRLTQGLPVKSWYSLRTKSTFLLWCHPHASFGVMMAVVGVGFLACLVFWCLEGFFFLFHRDVGPDDPLRCLPTWLILWFWDLITQLKYNYIVKPYLSNPSPKALILQMLNRVNHRLVRKAHV